eukprot:gene3748-6636_t
MMKTLILLLICFTSFSIAQTTNECDYQKLTTALRDANALIASINATSDYDIPNFVASSKTALIPVYNCLSQITKQNRNA